jgi:hypothetical protein
MFLQRFMVFGVGAIVAPATRSRTSRPEVRTLAKPRLLALDCLEEGLAPSPINDKLIRSVEPEETVMNVRKTDVAWDPSYERHEYVDERGEPYYCEIKSRQDTGGAEVSELSMNTDEAACLARLLTCLQVAAVCLTGLRSFLRRIFA